MMNGNRENFITPIQFKKNTGITLSEHSGKMEGIQSISTSCQDNLRCPNYQKCEGSICKFCFSNNYQNFRASLRESLIRNGIALRDHVMEINEFPLVNAYAFRIESFGDVDSVIQARNYIRFAKRNPQTRFGWWTKNPDIVDEAFRLEGGKPANISMVVSSIMLNEVRDVSMWNWVDVVFTVYTKAYLLAHPEIKINCGKRKCLACLQCYKKHKGLIYINELKK